MRVLPLLLAVVAGAVLASGPAAARRHDPEKLPETRIRDLHYGDVLFYYFQDDDFEALTRLTAYEHWSMSCHRLYKETRWGCSPGEARRWYSRI